METKALVVGAVIKEGAILMRKKPDGSPPYSETWYIFGAEIIAGVDPDKAIVEEVLAKAGIAVKVANRVSWDTEVKQDIDGSEKFFIYLDVICEFISGDLMPGEGVEKLKWVKPEDLPSYDIVPPSQIFFKKLGYLI